MKTIQELFETYEETGDVTLLDDILEEEYKQDLLLRIRDYDEMISEYSDGGDA